jgi:regulatory protein
MSRKITKIEIQKKNKNRCSIYLDDEFAFGIDQDGLLKFNLTKGLLLTDEGINQILAYDERRTAKERALRLLAHRDRSEKEIIDRLKLLGYNKEVIAWVLEELQRLKYIDDERFAINFVKTKMLIKPLGEFAIRRELSQKGINENFIDQAVATAFRDKDEFTIAQQLAERQLEKNKNLEQAKRLKKVTDFLLRRGFNWDIIREVIENINK